MRTSTRGKDWIAVKEGGHVLRAYRCPANVWTIGVGLTAASGVVKPRAGMVITREASEELYDEALVKYEKRTLAALPALSPQHVFDGGVSFDWNTGRIHDASWPRLFQAGDFAGAERNLMAWDKVRGKPLRGLTLRRQAEANLIFRGVYGDGGPSLASPGRHDANNRVPALRRTMVGGAVRQLQEELQTLGYFKGDVDGMFGIVTERAVREFQGHHPDLVVDGIAGAATMAQIQRALDARSKGKTTAGSGAVVTGGATAGNEAPGGADITGVPTEIIVALGVMATLAVLVYIGWRYRDVIALTVNRWRGK